MRYAVYFFLISSIVLASCSIGWTPAEERVQVYVGPSLPDNKTSIIQYYFKRGHIPPHEDIYIDDNHFSKKDQVVVNYVVLPGKHHIAFRISIRSYGWLTGALELNMEPGHVYSLWGTSEGFINKSAKVCVYDKTIKEYAICVKYPKRSSPGYYPG